MLSYGRIEVKKSKLNELQAVLFSIEWYGTFTTVFAFYWDNSIDNNIVNTFPNDTYLAFRTVDQAEMEIRLMIIKCNMGR